MPNDEKKLTVSNQLLDDIEIAMDDNSFETEWYLDMQGQEATFLCDPSLTGEYEEMERLEQLIEKDEEDRFIFIPGRSSHEAWEQMERFILSLHDHDEKTRKLLLTTIQGSGAFSRFKDAINRVGLAERWYEYRNRENRREALNWLRSLDLITDDDIDKGMKLYEERLQKRKRREDDIANMTKGKMVQCAVVHDHEDKLTVGKTYEVLGEQKKHLNIRIRDDRGKLVWLSKSHFELRG